MAHASRPQRAAQYLRMSTEHQQYSIDNQTDAIKAFALLNNYQVVRTYRDEGKSGLTLDSRAALCELIDDVQKGQTDYKVILVYDVSRWGRFQDTDESAHLEYLCRKAGVHVEYCAEQFTNDGTTLASIIKALKRAMAAEYSRELSEKVFAGKIRLARLGFRQGGNAGFGLRRRAIDKDGRPRNVLRVGERKGNPTDRIILIPGPAREIATIRWIYKTYIGGKRSEKSIAEELNRKNVKNGSGRKWQRDSVKQILTNEKYLGNNVWARSSFKLKRTHVKNAPSDWARVNGAFSPIVSARMFQRAKAVRKNRGVQQPTDTELIRSLKKLLAKTGGDISRRVIYDADQAFTVSRCRRRFGGLLKAYKLTGFTPKADYHYKSMNAFAREHRAALIKQLMATLELIDARPVWNWRTGLITIHGGTSISVVVARARQRYGKGYRWHVAARHSDANIVALARMAPGDGEILDYFLLPATHSRKTVIVARHNGLPFDLFRLRNLEALVGYFRGCEARAMKPGKLAVKKGESFSTDNPGMPRFPEVGKVIRETGLAARRQKKRKSGAPRKWEDSKSFLANFGRVSSLKLRVVKAALRSRCSFSVLASTFECLLRDDGFVAILHGENLQDYPSNILNSDLSAGVFGSLFSEDVQEDALHQLNAEGICAGAEQILGKPSLGPRALRLIARMTPKRQIEAAKLIVATNSRTDRNAVAILGATASCDLVKQYAKKRLVTNVGDVEKLEHETAILDGLFLSTGTDYADVAVRLAIMIGYVRRLIGNDRIVQYLKRRHRAALVTLEKHSQIDAAIHLTL